MAPKKNTDLAQKIVRKRVPKEKLVKPKLKTPTIIKVQIQGLGSGASSKLKRNVTVQQKIELANEVALAQLAKSTPAEVEPSNTKLMPSPESKKTPIRKKTHTEKLKQSNKVANSVRKRKLISNVDAHNDSESDNTPLVTTTADATKSKRPRKPTPKLTSYRVALSKVEIHTSSEKPQVSLSDIPAGKDQQPIKTKPRTRAMTATPKQNNDTQTMTNGDESSVEVSKETVIPEPAPTAKGPGRKRQQKKAHYFPEVPTFSSSSESSASDTLKTAKKEVQRKKAIPKKSPSPRAPVSVEPKGAQKSSIVVAVKRTRGRPKLDSERASLNKDYANTELQKKVKVTKGKVLNGAEIKAAASELENALQNTDQAAQIETNSVKSCHSVKSNNSSLSWTRDISTSSTTTCLTVSSHDFIRFNNKLPIVQLYNNSNIKQEVEERSSSSSDSESSDSSPTESNADEVSKPELNLSTSSLSLQSEQPRTKSIDNTKLLCLEMDKLKSSLKNFYAEMEKWIVCDDDEACTFSNVFEALDLEKNLAVTFENFKSNVEKLNHNVQNQNPEDNPEKVEFVKPCFRKPAVARRGGKSPNVSAVVPSNSAAVEHSPGSEKRGSFENSTADNCNDDVPLDKTYDDEDALSLFAESITGIESSRLNSSAASNSNVSSHDVYVPKPKTELPDKYTYKPTRIDAEPQKPKTVCEKQNADSTSIRDSDINKKTIQLIDDASRVSLVASVSAPSQNKDPPESATKPRLFRLDSHYSVTNPVKSRVYRNFCFFYLIGTCKNLISCRFPHVEPQRQYLEKRLQELDEDELIGEYLLTRSFAPLRWKYGLLFVEECMRRDSTRILMEMAIYFGLNCVSREGYPLRVSTLECALMHLNTVSLDACDDLLKVESGGLMLCDVLLRSIAESQNFARFKPVFIKLSQFMLEIDRPVDADVVGKILERVCILPSEGALAQAMLNLIKNTDRIIFQNRMTEPFEVQLSTLEGDVYEEYLLQKKAAIEAMLEQPYVQEVQPTNVVTERKRYTSPDTTNMDSSKIGMAHTPTMITRTIDCTQPANTTVRYAFESPAMAPRAMAPRHFIRNAGLGPGWSQRPMRPRGMRPMRRVVYRSAYGGGANI